MSKPLFDQEELIAKFANASAKGYNFFLAGLILARIHVR